MSLQVWLPLNGDLHNQGLNSNFTISGSPTFNNAGKIGKCLASQINFTTFSWMTFRPENNFSFAIWAKGNITSSTTYIIACTAFELRVSTSNIRIGWGSSANEPAVWTATVDTDTWYHICFTWEGTTKLLKLYINGDLKATSNVVGSVPTSIAATTNLPYNGSRYLNDFRIYNHCLSPKEVEEIAKGLVLHYKLDLPQYNLLKLGNVEQVGNSQSVHILYYYYDFSGNLPTGTYTLSFDAKTSTGTDSCYVSYANGSSTIVRIATLTNIPSVWTHYSYTFTNSSTNSNDIFFTSYKSYGSPTNANNTGILYVKNVKLENGNKATPFELAASEGRTPATAIIYDSSGYSNNGTIVGSLAAAAPSPRYDVATVFNGTNSAIKVNSNVWMIQRTQQLTINLWAKATTWPTNGGRLISCTETGGFNFEAGNSGYWRFPVHVYTSADSSSTAYKYDSKEIKIADLMPDAWNMITCVYEADKGTKTYINGELHHTYSNVSYGIHFNTMARLFLGCEANAASPTSPYFNGQISDFRIYVTALTDGANNTINQIKELYNTSMTIDSSGNIHARELVEL